MIDFSVVNSQIFELDDLVLIMPDVIDVGSKSCSAINPNCQKSNGATASTCSLDTQVSHLTIQVIAKDIKHTEHIVTAI